MDLSPYYINHGMIGEADGLAAPHTADLYLLDKSGTVLSQHTKSGENVIGRSFFELYPATAVERNAFAEALSGFEYRNLLFLTKSSPALLACSAFGKSGMALCALPVGAVAKTLSHPCDFAGVLPNLILSPSAAQRRKAHTSEDFLAASRWYTPFARAFCTVADTEGHALAHALSTRASYLALLCGVRIEFDFRNVVLLRNTGVDLDVYTGLLTAALMAAQRMDAGQTVQMYLDRNDRDGALLYLKLSSPDVQDSVPELELTDLCAQMRGMIHHAVRYHDTPTEVQLCASLTPRELSAQGVKQDHPLWRWPSSLDYAPRSIPIEQADNDQ